MLGFYEVLMARLLLAFVIPVTFLVHDLWTVEEERPVHGTSIQPVSLRVVFWFLYIDEYTRARARTNTHTRTHPHTYMYVHVRSLTYMLICNIYQMTSRH